MKWIGQHIFDLKSRFRNDVTIDGDLTVSGTYTQIDTDVTTTEQWLVTNDGTGPAAIINQKGSQDIFDIQDDGTSVFYIEDGGKVGIGTTSPSFELDVVGNIGMDNKLYHNGDHNTYIGFESDDIKLRTGGVDVITVNSSQNVGIGTTSPSQKLEVSGNVKISDSAGPYLNLYRDDNIINSGDHLGSIVFGGGPEAYQESPLADSAIVLKAEAADTAASGNSPSKLTIQGVNDGSAALSDWVVLSNGNVGIGTASPDDKLHVSGGNIRVTANSSTAAILSLHPNNGNSVDKWQIAADADGSNLNISNKSTGSMVSTMYLKDDGNVGIGTTSPSKELHIKSSAPRVLIEGTGASAEDAEISRISGLWDGTYVADIQFLAGDDTSNKDNGKIAFRTYTSDGAVGTRMLIEEAGNVGIGTTSPSEKLQVSGTLAITQNDTAYSGGYFTKIKSGYNANPFIIESKYGDLIKAESYGKALSFHTGESATAERLRILSNGNVGIGTTSPSAKLEVVGQGAGTVKIGSSGFGGDWVGISLSGALNTSNYNLLGSSANSSFYLNRPSGGDMFFRCNNADQMIIKASGNVGIGTTSPASLLHVAGTVQVGVDDTGHDVKFFGATSGKYMLWDEDNNGGTLILSDNVYFRLGNSNDLYFWHTGADTKMQNNTGDLYITNTANDKDIIFQSDDGSGGVETYFFLDGSMSSGNPWTIFPDQSRLGFGDGLDLRFYHDGTNSYVENEGGNLYIRNDADDKDIIFQCDDGSGGAETYFFLDGSANTSGSPKTIFPDNSHLALGNSGDFLMYHDGTNTTLDNLTGNITIQNKSDDGDIIFQSDDGSGGVETYFFLDGSTGVTTFPDSKILGLGTGADLQIKHDGSNGQIREHTGNLTIINSADDGDIIFQSDDGSGGVETYFFLDGSSGHTTFPDGKILSLGTGRDLRFYHDGSNGQIQEFTGDLKIVNNADDKDIILMSDNGSGGTTAYLTLDGSAGTIEAAKDIAVTKGSATIKVEESGGADMRMSAGGSTGYIGTWSNDQVYIMQNSASAITIDTNRNATFAGDVTVGDDIFIADNGHLNIGSSNDLKLYHDGSDSYLRAYGTTDLIIMHDQADRDIKFKADDGSGGTATYLQIDGGSTRTRAFKDINFDDNIKATYGAGSDLKIYHYGTGSMIENETGPLQIKQDADNEDIQFFCDDGSGGMTAYLTLDGSAGTIEVAKEMNLAVSLATDQQKHLAWFEIAGFGTGDGTNYEISVNLDNDTAPFSHNVSTGANGTTAITVQNIMRSGGTVMTRAGTIKRWTGWATTAGSSTANVALFKITPARNDNSDVAPVLIDNVSYTAVGNAKMLDFNETSFTDASVAAGDIVVTGIKCEDTKTTYFSSTLEIEF